VLSLASLVRPWLMCAPFWLQLALVALFLCKLISPLTLIVNSFYFILELPHLFFFLWVRECILNLHSIANSRIGIFFNTISQTKGSINGWKCSRRSFYLGWQLYFQKVNFEMITTSKHYLICILQQVKEVSGH